MSMAPVITSAPSAVFCCAMAFPHGRRISLQHLPTSGLPWLRPVLLVTVCSVVCLFTHSSTRPSCSCTTPRLLGPTLVTRRWPDTDYNIVDEVAPSRTGLVLDPYASLTVFMLLTIICPRPNNPYLARRPRSPANRDIHPPAAMRRASVPDTIGPKHRWATISASLPTATAAPERIPPDGRPRQ